MLKYLTQYGNTHMLTNLSWLQTFTGSSHIPAAQPDKTNKNAAE